MLNSKRYFGIMKRADAFNKEGNNKLSLLILGRVQKALSIIKPEATVFSAPAKNGKADTPEAYRKSVDHRAPVIGKMDVSAPVYCYAKRAVAGKIRGARIRGIPDGNNVYLQHYPDFLHEAVLAIAEAETEALRIQSLTPTGYDVPEIDAGEIYDTALFADVFRVLGRKAYQIENRGKLERRTEDKEGKTPTLKVDVKSIKAETAGTFRTSRIETAYCRKEAFSAFYRNAFQVVRTANITEQQRQEMLSLLKGKTENVKELDQRRKHLKRLLLKTGVLEKDITGALKI